jgi:hypothetical protein
MRPWPPGTTCKGARQKSDARLGGTSKLCSAFPEILEPPAEFGTAESDNRIGSANRPKHAAALQSGADGDLAASFHNAGRSAETLLVELRISHAILIVVDVVPALPGFFGVVGVTSQSPQEIWETAAVEFFMTALSPELGLFGSGSIEGFGDITEMLFDVKAVDDLDSSWEQFLRDFPDPAGPVTENHGLGSFGKAAASRLAKHSLGEGGGDRIGIQGGSGFNGCGVSDRTDITDRAVFAIPGFGAPDRAQLDFAGFGASVGLLAGAVFQFGGAHGNARAVDAEIEGVR